MIVVDASAALSALLNANVAREVLSSEQLHAPHLVDVEIANGLRRATASGRVSSAAGWGALDTWRRLAVSRYPMVSAVDRIWELRANLTAYDAAYVALAELLGCSLLTADARLGRAPGARCPVTVVPK